MNILIVIGVIIVFISTFFIFYSGDVAFDNIFDCSAGKDNETCTYKGFSPIAVISTFLIAFFLVIIGLTVKIIHGNLTQ